MMLSAFHAHVLAQRAHAAAGPLSEEQVASILSDGRAHELRVARGFRECRGLKPEQLEDIYQDTVIALLRREHRNDEHLIGALRLGIKQRALKHHRDERRRLEILQQHAPGIERAAAARAAEHEPERQAMLSEDRRTAEEFLAQLNGIERRMFSACVLHGLGYRAAAQVFGIDARAARRAARAAERKREEYRAMTLGGQGR